MADWDGIKSCEKCGEYTTGILCTSCSQQQQIDNDNMSVYTPVDFGDYDYDDYYYDYEDDYPEYGILYHPLTRREHIEYNLTHLREYLPKLYKRIIHKLRYTFSIAYRESYDEIPF